MATNFTPVGSEIQVNAVTNFSEQDADIAVATDGRFLIAYEQAINGDADIRLRFVDANGTAGSDVLVETSMGIQRDPAVAPRLDGGATVVWRNSATGDVQYAVVSGAAGPTQDLIAGSAFVLDIAALADGRALVVAAQVNATTDIVFRFIDANGAPSGTQAILDDGAGDQDLPAIAAYLNNALVVYQDTAAGSSDIAARFYDGTAFATEIVVADSGSLFEPDVVALADGRFIVIWEEDDSDDIQGRIVGAAGAPLGAVFTISNAAGDNLHPRVAALPDGGFIVTWENTGGLIPPEVDSGDGAVFARRFDASGAPAGDLFLVNTGDPDTFQGRPAVAINPATGQSYIAWDDNHDFGASGGDPDPTGVRGHAFLATVEVVNGSGADDVITTYSLGETINGLDGDDAINALGGNDVVHGGAGFDRIAGGLGDDQLFGEGGEDLLKGEDGDDLLVGGLGRDVQLGGAGKDIFDFNKVAESRFGANHDLIKGFKHSEKDKIDLKTIDADLTAGGNQAFDLIGAAAFSGAAGELRFAAGLLQGDVNGDGIADLEVKVTGLGAAANSDFVL